MEEILFPLLVLCTAAATWGFTLVVRKYAQGEVREKYLERFENRTKFSKLIAMAAIIWLLTAL
ncbi:hypothetical protein GW915_08095 [bacterium]|nr:hypothetical protein [bacterium]